ncbi:hypothetical protein [Paraburkholderia sp. BCC1886]|uniref:hypothetical protein n=1 Tax=Paraburkholderia sp. BCC1886 TaxID=2562670 RepID=UPI001181EE19|nr:hypothetical protein [Paraburkholderia sp. BCC1886]
MSEHQHNPHERPLLPDAFDQLPAEPPAALEAPVQGFDQLEESPTDAEQAAPAETPVRAPLPPSQTTQQDTEVFFPLDGVWDETGTFLIGNTDTHQRTVDTLESMPNIRLEEHESGREFVDLITAALDGTPKNDRWRATVDRPGTEWRQSVKSEKGGISMGQVKFNNIAEGEKLTGERAILQVRSLLNLGSTIQTPLWHSGFHVTIKAPSDLAQIELNRRLSDEKIVLGRTTNGLAFANASAYLTGGILDFVMEHVYDTSLQDKDPQKIKELIDTRDLPLLFWGLACAIWPRGFQYARPYLDPVTNEEKVLREKIAVGKLLWVDTKSLTPWQIAHMANRGSGRQTLENVQRYRSEFTIGQPRRVELRKDMAVTLAPPRAIDYVYSGYKWIGEITRLVDEALGLSADDRRRANLIIENGKATNMRQYIHWVQTMHPAGGIVTEDDRETIERLIDDLSGDDEARVKYFAEVQKYIDETTIAVIATPTVTAAEENKFPRFPHLLPMNVEQTFFTLLEQKMSQISRRT